MADKKISELNTASSVYDADDFALVQDGETKQVNASTVKAYAKDGLSKSDVGLGNVDNTSDATKNSAVATLTNKTISGSSNTLSNIANASLTNSSITINGNAVSLGGSTTVSAATTNTLTIGTGLSGTSFDGSAATTIAIDSSVVTLTGTQTLTNKTLTSPSISGGTANNVAIGGTTPAAGAFTTLSSTGNTTLGDASGDALTINAGTTTFAQGTANGVLYLNGSKAATSGSALTFDGNYLALTGTGNIARFGNGTDAFNLRFRGGNNWSIQYTPSTDEWALQRNSVNQYSANGSSHIWAFPASDGMRLTSKGLLVGYTDDQYLSGTGNAIFSGNVGIGTSSLTYGGQLTVRGATQNIASFMNSNFVAATSGTQLNINAGATTGNTNFQLQVNSSGGLAFGDLALQPSGGNVGIGTSSPGYKLDVSGTVRSDLRVGVIAANPDVSAFLIQATTTTNAAAMKFINGGGSGYVGLDNSAANRLGGSAYALTMWHEGAYPLCFGTNNTLRATIDTSGNLGLGVTPSASYLTLPSAIQMGQISVLSQDVNSFYINANASAPAGKYLRTGSYAVSYHLDSSAGSHKWFLAGVGTAGNFISPNQAMTLNSAGNLLVGGTSDSNSCRFVVTNTNASRTWGFGTSGSATAFYVLDGTSGNGVYIAAGNTSWAATSDDRLKTDLKPITNAAEKVSTLRAVTGRYKTDDEGISRAFLIAQDVQAVLPEAVDATDPDKLGVRYTDTIPLLVAAIKELHAEIERLKSKLN